MECRGYGWSYYAKRHDIIHAFNFNMHWNAWLREPKYHNTKYVCSMIYQPNQTYFTTEELQKMYDNLDAVILLHEGEEKRLIADGIKIDKSKHYIVPNGIEDYWYGSQLVVPAQSYVLSVGRISEHKGQEYVAKACASIGAPYINIGGGQDKTINFPNGGYFKNINDIPREELKEWYKNCACLVLASKDELMPMVVMEAGMQAKNIVLTNGCDWKLPHVEYVKYGDIEGIANAIIKSVKKPPNYPLQSMLKKMTWENTSNLLKKIYEVL